MASLDKLAKLYQRTKESVALEMKARNDLKKIRSVEKRLSARIALLERKMDAEGEHTSDISATLVQRNSQMDSIGRLIDGAKQRLSMEKNEIITVEQKAAPADDSDGRQDADYRLQQLTRHVQDLVSEINSREKTAGKVVREIAQYSKMKSESFSKIQKHAQLKNSLKKTMANSRSMAKNLAGELKKQVQAVAYAEQASKQETLRLQNALAKRAKTASSKKKPAKPAKKPSASKPAKKPSASKPAKKPVKKLAKSKKIKNPTKPVPKPKITAKTPSKPEPKPAKKPSASKPAKKPSASKPAKKPVKKLAKSKKIKNPTKPVPKPKITAKTPGKPESKPAKKTTKVKSKKTTKPASASKPAKKTTKPASASKAAKTTSGKKK